MGMCTFTTYRQINKVSPIMHLIPAKERQSYVRVLGRLFVNGMGWLWIFMVNRK
jgi:hypothetical protein